VTARLRTPGTTVNGVSSYKRSIVRLRDGTSSTSKLLMGLRAASIHPASLGDCWATVERAANAPLAAREDLRVRFGGQPVRAPFWLNHTVRWHPKRREWDSNPRVILTATAGFQDLISGQRSPEQLR
jgi:hypothetical protein